MFWAIVLLGVVGIASTFLMWRSERRDRPTRLRLQYRRRHERGW